MNVTDDTLHGADPSRIAYACPRCHALLDADGTKLRCPHDGYTNRPLHGIRDFLSDDDRLRQNPFMEEYAAIRRAERRGSGDAAYYLALPDAAPDDPHRREWRMRGESLVWLRNRMAEPAHADPLRVLDAGAGNCWLTRWLAVWGHIAVALDLNIDQYDGLGAGRHYLDALPVGFERVRSDFLHLPFTGAAFDRVIFNASLHYAADLPAVLSEARRVTCAGGSIVIIDSPIYSSEAGGLRMLAERGGTGRSRFLTFSLLSDIARDLGLVPEFDPPKLSMYRRLRRSIQARRLGREPASMARVMMTKE